MSRLLSVLVLVSYGALAEAGTPAKVAGPPAKMGGPPPSLVVLSKVDSEKKEIAYTVTAIIAVPVQVSFQVLMNGKIVEMVRTELRTETRMQEIVYPLEKIRVFNLAGKVVPTAEVVRNLRPGMAVVLSGTKEMISPALARILREDTLILAVPGAEAPVIPLPAPGPMPIPGPGK